VSEQSVPKGLFEGHARVPGARIWYKDSRGSGVPILLLHAATGSSRAWEYQFPALAAAGYRVIAYDRRGFGLTQAGAGDGPQPGTGADDLRALVDFLGIDKFHMLGTAAGGMVCVDFALSFPGYLRSMIVTNSIVGLHDQEYLDMRMRTRAFPEYGSLPPAFRELGPSYRAVNPDGVQRWIDLEHLSKPAIPLEKPQAFRNRATLALLETIKVPTLLMTGDADLATPAAMLRLFHSRMKHAEFSIIPESGHSGYWEQPEYFNRRVLDFIRQY
jgi:pimeloyl-ACP methyl ester carboxylesterase